MAGYNEIKGLRVKYLSADPSNAEDGQVWYNSTSGNLRVKGIGLESFTSSSPLNTARYFMAGAGIQTAALSFGGDASPPYTNASEEYNGSGWSNTPSMNTARTSLAGAGTSTAGLGFGGYFAPPASNKNETEEYNGSSWSEQNNLGTARYRLAGAGTQTAGLAFGGNAGATSPTVSADTEEYNGTSWSEQNNLSQGRRQLGGLGTQTAALAFGGRKQPGNVDVTDTEEYDGTSWSSGGALPQISRGYGGTAGTQTAGLSIGGTIAPGMYNGALKYDGSTWSISPATLATGTNEGSGLMSGSTQSAGMVAGGYGPSSVLANTEEFNISTNTITAAAWASAPSIGTGRYLGGYGITPTNASIIFGGQSTTSESKTEEYNGTSWAENPDMNTARSRINGFGTQTAAVTMGGRQVGVPPNVNMNNTELYDGSSWTNGPSYPLTVRGIGGAGTNAAGLAIAAWTGSPPGFTTCNDWNGSGWTAAEANLNTARGYVSGWGTQSDAGAAGGPPANTNYEEYNGSSWTTKTSLITATGGPSGGAAGFGGTPGAIKANGNGGTFSQEWNGTSWKTAASRANTNYGGGMSGGNTAASGIVTGGYIYPSTGPANGSEEFTGETVAAAPASTLTTS